MITINNLTKKFNEKAILSSLKLSLCEGDVAYIEGINGSGKTTLFKIICDILEKDSGDINFKKNVNIGALIENPNFIENETMLYNLKFLANINKNYNHDTIDKLAKTFHLDIYCKTKMKSYSLGMRQKVGIIQAVMENQNLLIFDEPTRGLDNEAIITFKDLVNKLKEERKTVIIASHDYIEGINYTKKFILNDGKLYEVEINS